IRFFGLFYRRRLRRSLSAPRPSARWESAPAGRLVPVRLMTRFSSVWKGRCLMTVLDRASKELFSRKDDERFSSLEELAAHCRRDRELSQDRWERPAQITLTSDL